MTGLGSVTARACVVAAAGFQGVGEIPLAHNPDFACFGT